MKAKQASTIIGAVEASRMGRVNKKGKVKMGALKAVVCATWPWASWCND